MNPEIGFACSCRMLNQSRIVERRRLIGHQRRAGNAAEMKSRLVGLEHAEVNNAWRSEEHTSELQSLMRISYAVFCLQKKNALHDTTGKEIATTNIQHTDHK